MTAKEAIGRDWERRMFAARILELERALDLAQQALAARETLCDCRLCVAAREQEARTG